MWTGRSDNLTAVQIYDILYGKRGCHARDKINDSFTAQVA